MPQVPKGLLQVRDELSGWLGDFDRYGGSGGDRAFWIQAYDGRYYSVDRVKNSGSDTIVPRLLMGVCGGIQPDKLASLVLKSDDDGLASRFLTMWPNGVRPKRPTSFPDDTIALAALRKLSQLKMGESEDGSPTPRAIPLSDEAADTFDAWRSENVDDIQSVSGLLKSHFGKGPGLVLRLSLAIEYLWWAMSDEPEPTEISQRSLGFAAYLMDEYFKPMARRAYSDANMPKAERHAMAIARLIRHKQAERINARTIQREWKIPGLNVAKDVKDALSVLEECSVIRSAPTRAGKSPGASKGDWLVNPSLLGPST